jgi:Vacuolar protein 14 C-terminal Fig4p binding
MTVELGSQLCVVTKSLDLPHFSVLRMHMLQSTQYPDLLNAMKGLLMILPQGDSCFDLRARLECVSLCLDDDDVWDSNDHAPAVVSSG